MVHLDGSYDAEGAKPKAYIYLGTLRVGESGKPEQFGVLLQDVNAPSGDNYLIVGIRGLRRLMTQNPGDMELKRVRTLLLAARADKWRVANDLRVMRVSDFSPEPLARQQKNPSAKATQLSPF
jgi:hypothetical protein